MSTHTQSHNQWIQALRWTLVDRWNKRHRKCACQWVCESFNHREIEIYREKTGYFLPAEYGSCLSTYINSFLSYLARIHCSRSSLWGKSTYLFHILASSSHHTITEAVLVFASSLITRGRTLSQSVPVQALHTFVSYWYCLPFAWIKTLILCSQ